jgi:hypothetical protein
MNLTQLCLHINDNASSKSRYRRLQRFFQSVVFDYDALAHLIMQLFGFNEKRFYLTLDRTNWKWGKTNLNILTLAIAHKGIAIPVYWLVLNKQSNSNQRERIALLKRFIAQFGKYKILGILADREFIGWIPNLQVSEKIRPLRLAFQDYSVSAHFRFAIQTSQRRSG